MLHEYLLPNTVKGKIEGLYTLVSVLILLGYYQQNVQIQGSVKYCLGCQKSVLKSTYDSNKEAES